MKWENRDINVVERANTPKFSKLGNKLIPLRLLELLFDDVLVHMIGTVIKESLVMRFDVEDTEQACRASLGLHSFTGCDTVSAFSGKGKAKLVKLMLKENSYINLFNSFGNEPSLSKVQHRGFQQFACDLYGHKEDSTDVVRYKLYSARQGRLGAK